MAKERNGRRLFRAGILLCTAFFAFSSSCSFLGGSNSTVEKERATIEMATDVVSIQVGDLYVLIATATDGDPLQWSSSKEEVVVVSDGRIRAIGEGTAKITAHCAHAQAACTVVVTAAGSSASDSTDNSSGSTSDPVDDPIDDPTDRKLVWSDEFDGNALDTTKWGYQIGTHDVYHGIESRTEYWGNSEWQYYTEGAVSVSDGLLQIKATREDYGGMSYTSGRILTRDLATFTYGYIEAKIKLPTVAGMWPAFWMLPQPTDFTTTNNVYGGWAASGEVDIMEAKGRFPNESSSALHFGGGWGAHTYRSKTYNMEQSIEEWHVYAVDWRADHITWLVDGNEYFTLKASDWYTTASNKESAPFDQPFYLLLNLAVGGNFDSTGSQQLKNNEAFTSASMYVDYVRVYE